MIPRTETRYAPPMQGPPPASCPDDGACLLGLLLIFAAWYVATGGRVQP